VRDPKGYRSAPVAGRQTEDPGTRLSFLPDRRSMLGSACSNESIRDTAVLPRCAKDLPWMYSIDIHMRLLSFRSR
jgi:hypothetical protein